MSNRVSFSVEADSLSLRSIYKKDFLELQMKAISTANPNLNGSWFTRESLELSKDSFRNKPILGYFNTEGDFESHNGTWRQDIETGLDYWDTTNGEQVLGIIRENDEIKVVDDGELSWLCLSCALWTQYNFKQVKRLIKDAKRAKENGGTTKNISVEIDIISGEKQENGVYRIDEFKLVGITILGSRKGKPVMPGIEDAALSIPEIIGTDLYEKQQHAIRAAYARLDNSSDSEEEDVLTMTELKQSREEETAACANEGEGVCPECGQEPCVCSQDCGDDTAAMAKDCEACDGDRENECGGKMAQEESDGSEKKEDGADEDKGDDEDDDEDYECGREDECGHMDTDAGCEKSYADEAVSSDEVHDIAWLVNSMTYGFDEIRSTMRYYEFVQENGEAYPHAAYIRSVLGRVLNVQMQIQGTLGGLLNKIAGEISEDDVAKENMYAKYSNMEELVSLYEGELEAHKEFEAKIAEIEQRKSELENQIKTFELNQFLGQAANLINTSGVSEDEAASLYAKCQDGSIGDYDSLKKEVALALFEARETQTVNTHETASLQSPVVAPNMSSTFEAKAEKGEKRDSWAIMREYYGRK